MSRTVIPGRRLPVKRTSTEGGISSGMKPKGRGKGDKAGARRKGDA